MVDFDHRDIPGLYWTKDTRIGRITITSEPTPLRVEAEIYSEEGSFGLLMIQILIFIILLIPNLQLKAESISLMYLLR